MSRRMRKVGRVSARIQMAQNSIATRMFIPSWLVTPIQAM